MQRLPQEKRGRVKKNKRPAQAPPPVESSKPLMGPLSKKLMLGGLVVLVVGYVILSMADSRAENWAGLLSPFVILGGYGLIGAAFYLRER